MALAACGEALESVHALEQRLEREADALERALDSQPRPPPGPGEIRVRLAFGAEADLDLFVTDPSQETVYFGNTPARSGGALTVDLRCGEPAPRIEEVRFSPAGRGRYRVGVDFPKRCDSDGGPVPFVVHFESADLRESRRQVLTPHSFLPIVMEIDH